MRRSCLRVFTQIVLLQTDRKGGFDNQFVLLVTLRPQCHCERVRSRYVTGFLTADLIFAAAIAKRRNALG